MNQWNDKDKRHGPWENFYSNGKLEWRGSYVNGKAHDLWVLYYENGHLHYIGQYLKGEKIGYFKFLYSDGEVIDKTFYL